MHLHRSLPPSLSCLRYPRAPAHAYVGRGPCRCSQHAQETQETSSRGGWTEGREDTDWTPKQHAGLPRPIRLLNCLYHRGGLGVPTLCPASGQSLAEEWDAEDSVVGTVTVLGLGLRPPCCPPGSCWHCPQGRAPVRGCPWSQRMRVPSLEATGSCLSI